MLAKKTNSTWIFLSVAIVALTTLRRISGGRGASSLFGGWVLQGYTQTQEVSQKMIGSTGGGSSTALALKKALDCNECVVANPTWTETQRCIWTRNSCTYGFGLILLDGNTITFLPKTLHKRNDTDSHLCCLSKSIYFSMASHLACSSPTCSVGFLKIQGFNIAQELDEWVTAQSYIKKNPSSWGGCCCRPDVVVNVLSSASALVLWCAAGTRGSVNAWALLRLSAAPAVRQSSAGSA